MFLFSLAVVRADVITDPSLSITEIALNPLFFTLDIFAPLDAFDNYMGVNLSPQFVDFQWIVPTIPTPPTEPAPWPYGNANFTQPQDPPPSGPIDLDPPPGDPPPDDPPPVGTPEPGTMLGAGFVLAIFAIARRFRHTGA